VSSEARVPSIGIFSNGSEMAYSNELCATPCDRGCVWAGHQQLAAEEISEVRCRNRRHLRTELRSPDTITGCEQLVSTYDTQPLLAGEMKQMNKKSSGWTIAAMFLALFLALASGCGDAEVDTASTDSSDATPGALTHSDASSSAGGVNRPSLATASTSPSWFALAGDAGSSSQWGSGWFDLASPRDFPKGERIQLHVGGTAEKILVRLLAKGMSPDSSRGLLGGTISVPEDRIVEVTVDVDRKSVTQISVHGGPNPWSKPLGQTNGPATLEAVSVSPGG
jgi:hypothetical protein